MNHRTTRTAVFAAALAACHHDPNPAPDVVAALDASDVVPATDVTDASPDAMDAAPSSTARTGYVALTTYFDPATTLSANAQVGFEDVGTPLECAAPQPDLVGCSYVECPLVPDPFARPSAGVITLGSLATLTPDSLGNYMLTLVSGDPWGEAGVAVEVSAAGSTSVPAFTLALGNPGVAMVTAPAEMLANNMPWTITNGAAVSVDWTPRTEGSMEVTLIATIDAGQGQGILRCVFAPTDHAAVIPAAMITRLGAGAGGSFAFATLATSHATAGGYTVTGLGRRAALATSPTYAAGEFVVQ